VYTFGATTSLRWGWIDGDVRVRKNEEEFRVTSGWTGQGVGTSRHAHVVRGGLGEATVGGELRADRRGRTWRLKDGVMRSPDRVADARDFSSASVSPGHIPHAGACHGSGRMVSTSKGILCLPWLLCDALIVVADACVCLPGGVRGVRYRLHDCQGLPVRARKCRFGTVRVLATTSRFGRMRHRGACGLRPYEVVGLCPVCRRSAG